MNEVFMKSIVFIFVFLIAFTASLIIFNPKPVDPLATRLDFLSQTSAKIDFDQMLIASFQENISLSNVHFDVFNQTFSLKDTSTNAYLDVIQNKVDNNANNVVVLDSFVLESKGFENFIDTQGLRGTLQARFVNYRDAVNSYVETSVSLLNPPFNISLKELQYMPLAEASTQVITLIDLSAFTINPISIFKGLTITSLNSELYALPFGYKLIITNDNVLFTDTTSVIEVVIYNDTLIDMTLTIKGSSVTIPQTFIDGLEQDLIVALDIDFHYGLRYELETFIPYNVNDLALFERVDTFTLPDIASFLDNPLFN